MIYNSVRTVYSSSVSLISVSTSLILPELPVLVQGWGEWRSFVHLLPFFLHHGTELSDSEMTPLLINTFSVGKGLVSRIVKV